ncbi:hypothetical protein LTR36_005300 [Oleoguttula mirabilis]|uniref:STI1 domain-containing protein n=1 Tax=Oleoguttula mirabilis TaxID=1507867 RepID=A0AAV9JF45_9PEZI|nr:hypothetical protein LTR36_005300 [Oleoguttula mirabilis]
MSASATDTRKRLALSIIDFLSTSLKDGTLQSEDADSIEIASNCIAECFHVDPSDQAALRDATGGQNLLSIYGVYEKLKGKSTASTQGSNSASEARPSTPIPTSSGSGSKGTSTDESEKLKGQGNAAMQKKDYQGAIDSYTKALAIAPLNPIYLSNRAAAYSANNQHDLAKNDAELATATDPKYTKAWSRLGLARFAVGDAKGSMEAYESGIAAEGNGGSQAMKKGYETAKRRVEEEGAGGDNDDDDDDTDGTATTRSQPSAGGMPDLGSLASMFGGGGAGGGGMPDLSSLMSNPMVQNIMSNPDMMNSIMNNPQLRNMASRFGGGGAGGAGAGAGAGGQGGAQGGSGMPDLSSMMNDPAIAEMARNFMGGMGGAGRGAGGQQ